MSRILLVDESPLFRKLEANILGRNHQFQEASSGDEAWKEIQRDPPELVLSNLRLPGIDGMELCKKVKSDFSLSSIPFIIITATRHQEDIQEAVKAGCDCYLTKPLDGVNLTRKVEELIGNQRIRKFKRVPLSLKISFEDFKGIFFQFCRDLSRAGIFIDMEEPLEVGTHVRLDFSLPPPFSHPILAFGQVVRSAKDPDQQRCGVGVRFIWIDEESERIIDALVAGVTEPPNIDDADNFSKLSVLKSDSKTDPSQETFLLKSLKIEHEQLQMSFEQLQRDHQQLCATLVLAENLPQQLSIDKLLITSLDLLEDLVGVSKSAMYYYDAENQQLKLAKARNLGLDTAQALKAEGPVLQALNNMQMQIPLEPYRAGDGALVVSGVVPVMLEDHALGVIVLFELLPQKKELDAQDRQLLRMFSLQLGLNLAAKLCGRLQDKAGEKNFFKLLTCNH